MQVGIIPLCLAVAVTTAETPQQKVVHFRLGNGLTVLLRPVSGAEQVAMVTLFSLGDRHDPEGQSGFGHLIEHLYITAAAGAAKPRTAGEYMQRYPAGWNAQTGEDYTVVAAVFSKEALEEELRDAAARMGDLRVTDLDLTREKPRIVAEVGNMYGGIPALAARNVARERVRPSPPGARKGGVPQQLERIAVEEVMERWRRYYKPGNATLVLAGGFDAASAKAAITMHFADLPAGQPAPKVQSCGKPQTGSVANVAVKPNFPNAQARVCLAYAAPPPDSDVHAAFLVIVARMWARAAGMTGQFGGFPVTYAPLDDPGVVFLSAPVPPGETADKTVERLEALVSEAAGAEAGPADIMLAKNAFGLLLGLVDMPDAALAQNLYGVAFSLGRRTQLGIDSARLSRAIEAVTTERLRQAGGQVFAAGRRVAVVVSPEKATR